MLLFGAQTFEFMFSKPLKIKEISPVLMKAEADQVTKLI